MTLSKKHDAAWGKVEGLAVSDSIVDIMKSFESVIEARIRILEKEKENEIKRCVISSMMEKIQNEE